MLIIGRVYRSEPIEADFEFHRDPLNCVYASSVGKATF